MSDDPVQWYENLPEPLRAAPYFKPPEDGSHRTVEQVIEDLTNAAKLQGNLGDTHLRIPPPDASDEDKKAFSEKVLNLDPGLVRKPDDYSPVPESAEKYPEVEAEGIELAPIRELAHANKWTEQQYQNYVAKVKADTQAAGETQNQWKVDQEKAIGEKLGDARADHIARTVAAIKDTSPEVAELIQNNQLDARVVLALDGLVHQILDMGGEGSEFGQQQGAGNRGLTPGEAQSKCTEIRTRLTNERLPWAEQERLRGQLVEYQRLARAS